MGNEYTETMSALNNLGAVFIVSSQQMSVCLRCAPTLSVRLHCLCAHPVCAPTVSVRLHLLLKSVRLLPLHLDLQDELSQVK